MRPLIPPAPSAAGAAAAARHRHRCWALACAFGVFVGLGALLGHGLGVSLAQALPAEGVGAVPALLGATLAALLTPLAAWVALRTALPSAGRVTDVAATPVRLPVARAGDLLVASADAQAPARDGLTGAYTQPHFVIATDREWSRIRRHGEDAALLMVDLDHFKRLNEAHGRAAGDAMLVEITRLASSTLRPYDLLARFGGGVLVVYLPHTDPLGALDVAERIRERAFALRLPWHGLPLRATISVGVAAVGGAHAGLDEVIADAGAALREAKSAGRNCVRSAPIPPRHSHKPARSAG